MAATKMYLNVPFSEKDHAKALGARWDAGQKKWVSTLNPRVTTKNNRKILT